MGKSVAYHGDPGRVSLLVDPTMYVGKDSSPGGVYRDLDQAVRTDLYYHYSTPICAQRWLDVCNDPTYGHEELVDHLESALPEILSVVEDQHGTGARMRVVSLGPGDGAVDEHLLRGLDRQLAVESYCGLDFSFSLLRWAAHRFSKAEGFSRPFPIRMVCTDFTGVDPHNPVLMENTEPHLFTLTGFTFGNYREIDLLNSIGSMMRPGDLLLMDARLHDFGAFKGREPAGLMNSQAWSGRYDLDSVRRFVFGPVEVATMANADEVEIQFDLTQSRTSVPNAVNMVIYCSGLDTTLRFTGEKVRRARLDLAFTSTYNLPDLEPFFVRMGFSPLWHTRLKDVAFFLLCRD